MNHSLNLYSWSNCTNFPTIRITLLQDACDQTATGSTEEAEKKLEDLRNDLGAVVKKIKDAEKEKEKIVDQVKHWKKELASRARDEDELNAEVEALFAQCGKKDEEVAKKAEENVGEESRTSWW
ncbi:hypothetical protein HDV62DRAFT_388892 [Trichoderma sp. SZMC 28011]